MITKEKINQAGYSLIGKSKKPSKSKSNIVLKDFRFIHQHPMTLFRHTIDRKLKKHNIDALVSQRLKRIPSIIKKLKIQKNMGLSRMQDIGGLRIVVNSIREVNLIRDELVKVETHRNFTFTFAKEKDYIKNPPNSGYRSVHMVYKYDKNIPLEKQCRVEIQIRTKIQHSWATAVEVTGTYLNQPLKQSFGEKKYLDVFKKISKLFISLEERNIDYELAKDVKKDINNIELIKKLEGFNIATYHIASNNQGKFLLLKMDFKSEVIEIHQYSQRKFAEANEDYLKMELGNLDNAAVEVVLVSIQDINKLRQSYPNYFMDTKDFIYNLTTIFKGLEFKELSNSIKNKEIKKNTDIAFKDTLVNTIKQLDRSNK